MPIFLLLLHFFFYQYHIFLFQNNKLLITQNKSKRRTIKFLLFSQNLLRITVHQIDRAAFHQVIKNLAPFLPSLLDDASRVSQQSVSPQFCNSVLSLHRPFQDATSEAVFLLPFFFFLSSAKQFQQGLCADLRGFKYRSLSRSAISQRSPILRGFPELYEEGGTIYQPRIPGTDVLSPNPAVSGVEGEADKLPLFQQLETPRTRADPRGCIQPSSFRLFSSALPSPLCPRSSSGGTNRLRYRPA